MTLVMTVHPNYVPVEVGGSEFSVCRELQFCTGHDLER